MTESVIADLMVVLSTKVDTAIAGFTEVSSAGEAMATKVAESTAEVTAASDKMAGSIASVGAAAETTAAKTSTQLSEADGRFVAAGGSAQRFGEQTTAASGEVDAATVRMAHALEKVGIAAETAATENKLAMDKMAADTAALSAKMEIAAAKAAASNDGISNAYKKTEEDAAKSGSGQAKSFGLAAAATAGLGLVAIDMAAKYETSTTRLVTSAGESEQAIGQVRQGMLDMAGQVGVSADKLSQGMYTVESAGYHGADALKVLKAAAQGAKEENAQLSTVADAVSTALTDYHMSADQSATVTSQLVTAVGQGKTTMEEFSGSLHNVTPLASSLHISLADVTGTLAEMTAHGMSADQASQNLAHTIRSLNQPTSQQRQEFAQLGLSATDLSDHIGQRGISGTLELLQQTILQKMGPSGKVLLDAFNSSKDAANNMQIIISKMPAPLANLAKEFDGGKLSLAEFTKQAKAMPGDAGQMGAAFLAAHQQAEGFTNAIKNGSPQAQNFTQAMAKATGTADGLNTALMVTGENAAGTNDNIKKIAGAATEAGGNVKGWHDIQATFNQKLDEAKAALGSMAIQIGNVLLPILTPVIHAVADFAGWLGKHPTLAKAAAIAIGVLAVGFAAAAVAVWAMNSALLANPITWIIIAVVALVAGIVALATHWKQVWSAVGSALHAVYTAVIKPVIDAIVAAAKAVAAAFTWLWQNILKPVFDAISVAVRFVAMIIADVLVVPVIIVIKVLGAIFKWLWEVAIKPVVDFIGDAMHWLYDNVFKPVGDAIGKVLDAIGTAAKWLYDNFIKPVVDAISGAWHWLYDNVIKPVADWIKKAFETVGITSRIMYDSYVKPVVDAISGAWHWLYDNAIKPVADWIGGVVHGVGQAFSDAFTWVKGIIQDVWNFIKPIFDAIGKAIGWVSDALGGIGKTIGGAFSGIAHFLGFDDGGFVPGAQGAPMLAVVHGGEYVVSNDMQAGRAPIDPKLGGQLVSSGSGIRASGGSSSGGGGTVVQIIVQGNAVTERQLADVIQTGMLRAGQRRPVTYQNYRR